MKKKLEIYLNLPNSSLAETISSNKTEIENQLAILKAKIENISKNRASLIRKSFLRNLRQKTCMRKFSDFTNRKSSKEDTSSQNIDNSRTILLNRHLPRIEVTPTRIAISRNEYLTTEESSNARNYLEDRIKSVLLKKLSTNSCKFTQKFYTALFSNRFTRNSNYRSLSNNRVRAKFYARENTENISGNGLLGTNTSKLLKNSLQYNNLKKYPTIKETTIRTRNDFNAPFFRLPSITSPI